MLFCLQKTTFARIENSFVVKVRIFATSINKQIALSGLFLVYLFYVDEVVQPDNNYFLSTYDFRKNELYIFLLQCSSTE